jgi:hypothetical protein
MANLFIGSSNVSRFYRAKDHSRFREYKVVKCTQVSGFKAYMESMDKDKSSVLISVIENFLIDAVGADVEKPEAAINECIDDFLKIVKETAIKLPNTKFAIVMPMRRPSIQWYQEKVELITKELAGKVKSMTGKKLVNIGSIECVAPASQLFEEDLTHLTMPSSKIFLDWILDLAEDFFDAEQVDLSDDEEGEVENEEDDETRDLVKKLETRLTKLENESKLQRENTSANNMMFARIREEIDFGTNKAKEDRVVLTGLTSRTPIPEGNREKIDFLRKLAADVFNVLIPNFKGKVVYVSQGKQNAEALPMLEVKLDKQEFAIEIRKAFAEKRKRKELPDSLNKLFVANCVNLATRVRIDIMKAVARKVTDKNELAYVSGFISRPMMHIRKAGAPTNQRPLKSFTFIDTISRFGNLVVRGDLDAAYARAGRAFAGGMRQNFVVLEESVEAAGGPDKSFRFGHGSGSGSGSYGSRGRRGGEGFRGSDRGHYGGGSWRGKGTKRPGDNLYGSNTKK